VQESDAPDLTPMCRRHERAGRFYRSIAAAMAAGGALLALAALALPGPSPVAPLTLGLLLAALAVLPLARTIECRERAQGLAVLGEEWRTLAAGGGEGVGRAFAGLIARLHRRPVRG
jgi:hypothetical protein